MINQVELPKVVELSYDIIEVNPPEEYEFHWFLISTSGPKHKFDKNLHEKLQISSCVQGGRLVEMQRKLDTLGYVVFSETVRIYKEAIDDTGQKTLNATRIVIIYHLF